MPEQSVSLAELWRGSSSQPPWKRLPGQVDLARNWRMDISKGAVLRNPSQYIAELQQSPLLDYDLTPIRTGNAALDPDGSWFFSAIRDVIVAIGKDSGGDRQVHGWQLDGTPLDVVDLVTNLGQTTLDDGFDYIPVNPVSDVELISQGDTMYVASRNKKVDLDRAWSFRQCYHYLKYGNPNPPSVSPLETIPSSDFENTFNDPTQDPTADPNATDSGDVFVSFDVIQRLANLRDNFGDGYVAKARSDSEFDPAGYYMYIDTDAWTTEVSWSDVYPVWSPDTGGATESLIVTGADEIFPQHGANWYRLPKGETSADPDGSSQTAQGQGSARFDPDRMPFRIVYDEDNGRLIWSQPTWWQRLSGNNRDNREPSIAHSITACGPCRGTRSVAFYSGRLMIIGETSVVGSRTGEFQNFWIDNVGAINDADRIDKNISLDNIGQPLRSAVIGDRLLISCENGQIEFGSGAQQLTNANPQIREVSRYKTKDIRIGVGPGVCTILDAYDAVHQYQWINADDGVGYSGQLNIHDKDKTFNRTITEAINISRMLYLLQAEGSSLVHEIYVAGNQEYQSAWSSFRMDGTLRHVYEWGAAQYWIVLTDGAGWSMLKYVHDVSAPPDDMAFWPRLDRLETVTGTYDSTLKATLFSHTGIDGDADDSRLVVKSSGRVLAPQSINSAGQLVVPGDWEPKTGDAAEMFIGFKYSGRLRLSKLYAGHSAKRVKLGRLYVLHEDSTDYDVVVITEQGQEFTGRFQSDRAGVTVLDTQLLETGFSEYSPIGDARTLTIRIDHDSPGQAIISGVEYVVDILKQGQ